ncbi:MAG: cytochrome-c peroxidase [Psychrobium sp.]
MKKSAFLLRIPQFILVSLMMFSLSANANQWQALYKRPADIPFPSNNLYSSEKAALGKMLFFDPRLSRNFNMTCATCHNPSFGWEDATAGSTGAQNTVLPRHSPTVINAAWGDKFFWDGRSATLEDQALGPIESPIEMNTPIETVVERLSQVPQYRTWFQRVFGGEGITSLTIRKAIATYERTIVSGIAPFDRWIEGDEKAISASAKRGFELFNGKALCVTCHTGWNFTDNRFHDIALSGDDKGRGALTNNPLENFAFKTPGLRNIGQRAPYMHDGRFKTLEEVIEHYASDLPRRESRSPLLINISLTSQEVQDLKAFMLTLTGQDTPVTLPLLPY